MEHGSQRSSLNNQTERTILFLTKEQILTLPLDQIRQAQVNWLLEGFDGPGNPLVGSPMESKVKVFKDIMEKELKDLLDVECPYSLIEELKTLSSSQLDTFFKLKNVASDLKQKINLITKIGTMKMVMACTSEEVQAVSDIAAAHGISPLSREMPGSLKGMKVLHVGPDGVKEINNISELVQELAEGDMTPLEEPSEGGATPPTSLKKKFLH